jgi:hypothetical protein
MSELTDAMNNVMNNAADKIVTEDEEDFQQLMASLLSNNQVQQTMARAVFDALSSLRALSLQPKSRPRSQQIKKGRRTKA